MAQISFLTVLLVGVLIGVSALDTRLTSQLIIELFDYLPHVVAAIVILLAGSLISRFLARSVLIGAVNMQIQSARLLSVGVKWLVIVLAVAIALDHLRIGGMVVQVSFAILFGGIVLALALAVGLGSKDMVRQSWQRLRSRGRLRKRFINRWRRSHSRVVGIFRWGEAIRPHRKRRHR